MMCVFGVCVVNTDTDTYAGTQLHKVPTHNEQLKKGKYLDACLEQEQHFTPLMLIRQRRITNNCRLPCPTSGTVHTRRHVGMSVLSYS